MSRVESVFETEEYVQQLDAYGLGLWDKGIATDISATYGPLYTNFSQFSQADKLWRGNRFKVYPGSVPRPGAFSFTSADNNKFIYPNGTLSATTDYE